MKPNYFLYLFFILGMLLIGVCSCQIQKEQKSTLVNASYLLVALDGTSPVESMGTSLVYIVDLEPLAVTFTCFGEFAPADQIASTIHFVGKD